MKLNTILSLVAAAITAVAVSDDNTNTNTNQAAAIQGLPLKYALTPDAVELLQAHDIWAPDAAAFAAGTPNVAGVNATAEADKFRESGLDANEIVTVSIDTAAAVGLREEEGGGGVGVGDWTDCTQCDSCQSGCFILVVLLPLWGA